MGIHIYDLENCKVMTIAVCDMQSDSSNAHTQVWLSKLNILDKNGMSNVNFKGFMCNSAQINFNVVRILFGSGDPTVPMENKERTCQFHWRMSLECHTKQLIRLDLQAKYIRLCQEYQKYQSLLDADATMASIKAWWFSSRTVSKLGLKELHDWISF